MAYTSIENALIQRFLVHFEGDLTEDRISAGDPDAVMNAMFQGNKNYGVVLEHGGGREDQDKPFTRPVWIWSIEGVFFIRYGDDVEERLRYVVDKLSTLFVDDFRLGNTTPMAKFTTIYAPEPATVNDIPFYWLSFSIEALDK